MRRDQLNKIFERGYKKGTVGEFRHSINISLGSMEELSGDVDDCMEDGLIAKEEFAKLMELIGSADYMAGRYIISLNKTEREGTWKNPRGNQLKLQKVAGSCKKLHEVAGSA